MRLLIKSLLVFSLLLFFSAQNIVNVAYSADVYLKNGKKLNCDHAWKQGDTIYLVVHGKKFAVGYDQNNIDMKRSFGNNYDSSRSARKPQGATMKRNIPQKTRETINYNSEIKWKYGSNWEGAPVERSRNRQKSADQNYLYRKGSNGKRAYKSSGKGSPRTKKEYEKQQRDIDRHNRSVQQENERQRKAYQKNQREVEEHNARLREQNASNQQEYEKAKKGYENKRREVDAHNAKVKKHNERVRAHNARVREKNARIRSERKSSRSRIEFRKPYLGNDDPNRPYYQRHPASRR